MKCFRQVWIAPSGQRWLHEHQSDARVICHACYESAEFDLITFADGALEEVSAELDLTTFAEGALEEARRHAASKSRRSR